MNLRTLSDGAAVARAGANAIAEAAASSRERFAIALSGGSTPKATYALLAGGEYRDRIDWSRWHVFFGDERRVPLDDERSNYRSAHEGLLSQVAIPEAQVHPLTDADVYEGLLRAFFGESPAFDLQLLGMGEDGHTASIFADAPEWDFAISTPDRFVSVHPGAAPHARVSLSMSALTQAGQLYLFIAGQKKLDVFNAALAAPQKNAISTLAHAEGVKLDVYWCA
jgi:6-phosphogluconolactonase